MSHATLRRQRRLRRKTGLRKRMFGTPERPRLSIFRSNQHTYAQLIDDLTGRTLASASTSEKTAKVPGGANIASASEVGKRIAKRAKDAGIEQIVFDRNGFRYHGRIKALADAAREEGLRF